MQADIKRLLISIDLEEKEQLQRYKLDQSHTLKQLKAEGLAIHPIHVVKKSFGYADYPEISFRISFPMEVSQFRDGAVIECFMAGEESIKGVLLSFEGRVGEFRIFAPDFPDWMEDDGVGIKLAPDTRTTSIMKKALKDLENNPPLFRLFEELHYKGLVKPKSNELGKVSLKYINPHLNESQKQAVHAVVLNKDITIIHGPPGTGKTTTLIEAIHQLILKGEKVLLSAPSNTAVDHISKGLLQSGINLLRVGNISKIDSLVFSHTPEGKLINSKELKEIKELKHRAIEFRKMALKYKRSFGKAEREQRNLLFQEVKNIRAEIKKLQAYFEEKLFEEAQVIASTPIGLYDASFKKLIFHTLVMDEAGQCLEPLAWCVIPLAQKIVLAGDHWQLPPTVLSHEAAQSGFNQSILETAIKKLPNVFLLDIQYRMRHSIAGFSSNYFYRGLLKSAGHLKDTGRHITFIDTAGAGFTEKHGLDGSSLQNEGELNTIIQFIEIEKKFKTNTAFISPYSGQVTAAREALPRSIRISTIDSFQGQEMQHVIISLVRSNDDQNIGFLKDYRRMNVAITRAKEQLVVIGDSATIGNDLFFKSFLEYVETFGEYKTVWEFDII